MRALRMSLVIILMVLFTASCSVISYQVRTKAERNVPFTTLVQEKGTYTGKNVILGGYILETRNLEGKTIIEVLQAPLTYRDEPRSSYFSEGGLTVLHKAYLNQKRYSKDRKITVAGKLTDCRVQEVKTCTIESREIYLWPQYGLGYRSYDPYAGSNYYLHGSHHQRLY